MKDRTPEKRPFAGYEDFDACVIDQTKKGHSEGSARKICGSLQAKFEKARARAEADASRVHLQGQLGAIDKTSRSVSILASTPNPVDGEAITGWDLDRFKKNPVILWGHDATQLPIGTASDIDWDPQDGLKMRVRFASKEANPEAEKIWQGVQEGIVRAVSVGYVPKQRALTTIEGKPAIETLGELDEVSFVPIGADEDAGTAHLNPKAAPDADGDYDGDEPTDEDIKKAASVLARHGSRKRSILGAATDPNPTQIDPTIATNGPDESPGMGVPKKPQPDFSRTDSSDDAPPLGENECLRLDRARLGKVERTSVGGARVPARLTRTGVLTYVNPDGTRRRELRLEEEVFKADSVATLDAVPVIDIKDHTGLVTPATWRKVALGHVVGPKREGSFLTSDLVIQDQDTLDAIESGERTEISCGYKCRLDFTPGVHDGVAYDCVQRDIRYNHVALCPPNRGRAGPEVGLRLDERSPPWGVSHDEQEDVLMKTIRLDGRDYEVGSDAHLQKLEEMHKAEVTQVRTDAKTELDKTLEQHKSAVADFQKRLDKADGERDAAKAEADTARADAKRTREAADEEKVTMKREEAKRIAKRIRLLRLAMRFFGEKEDPDEEKMDGMADREIMLAAIKKSSPRMDAKELEGKSDDYVEARFDAACASLKSDRGVDGVVRAAREHAQVLANLDASDDALAANAKAMEESRKKRDELARRAHVPNGAGTQGGAK